MQKKQNKQLFLKVFIFLSALTLLSFSFANQRVIDEANLLEAKHKLVLERMIWEWESQTKHQMAILTVESLQGEDIESFAVRKFEELGIGSKENNDGILFVVAPNERRLRIEIGYGIEPYLPDGLVGEIRDKAIIPHFTKNDFPSGILQGTYALLMKQAEMEGVELPQLGSGELPSSPTNVVSHSQGSMVGFIIFIVIILIMMKSRTGRSILFWSLMASSLGGSRGRSYNSFGGNNFGGFGGGLGGFGGGFSGGGGASGRW